MFFTAETQSDVLSLSKGRREKPFRYEKDLLIRFRAIQALGLTTKTVYREDPARVMDLIRRLLWSMNDESGGLGWSAPEIIAEILVNCPMLIETNASLLPHYLTEEPFERGAHFAIARLMEHIPDLIEENRDQWIESLFRVCFP